jgi:hypothetical protein
VENYEDEGNRSALLGHPDVLKKVSVMSQSEIEREIKTEKVLSLKKSPRLLTVGRSDKDEEFEFTELSPQIFKNIRRIHNIDDNMVRTVF